MDDTIYQYRTEDTIPVGLLADAAIAELAEKHGMIKPFISSQKNRGVISYGLTSYGYDLRIANEFKIFTNVNSTIIDPKHFDNQNFIDRKVGTDVGEYIIIPPNGFALGYSLEWLHIPVDVAVTVVGKSTLARAGCHVLVTPLEPGWFGHVTIEIANTTSLPLKVYANEGICQCLFHKSGQRCQVSYADKKGKYLNQKNEVVLPVVVE